MNKKEKEASEVEREVYQVSQKPKRGRVLRRDILENGLEDMGRGWGEM